MSRKLVISVVLLLSLLLLFLATIASASSNPPLTISFIDIGQGDSMISMMLRSFHRDDCNRV
jgi:beta-lactamase superfamily II metal-dependent hydrolase